MSAVLIVKDEEDVLDECLAALPALCDEVVVYDTGSTDRTVEIARERGAKVVLGYWEDHFGEARARALAHATGTWFLWVDADEVLQLTDVRAARAQLASTSSLALLVDVQNQTEAGSGTPYTAAMRRMGQRAECWFTGRLHEQVMDRTAQPPQQEPVEGLWLLHSGYLAHRAQVKDKVTRNLRLAERAAEEEVETGLTRGDVQANLIRSHMLAGGSEQALALAGETLDVAHSGLSRRQIAISAASAASALGRFEEAETWLTRSRRPPARSGPPPRCASASSPPRSAGRRRSTSSSACPRSSWPTTARSWHVRRTSVPRSTPWCPWAGSPTPWSARSRCWQVDASTWR